MINLHWSWLVFIPICIAFGIWLLVTIKEPKGDYGFDILSPLIIIFFVAFVLIWGGFFWW